MLSGKQSIIEIKKYSKKGIGQGTSADFQKGIEVRGSHLHEKIRVEVLKRKQGVHEAKILEILEGHPCRVVPRCTHATLCGGCSWQSLAYDKQVVYKEERINELFKDVLEERVALPMIRMEDPWQFRNKMEFTFYQDREKNRCLGLVMGGTRGRVFNVEQCHLSRPWMSQIVRAVKRWWDNSDVTAYHRLKNEGTLHTLTLREGMRTQEKMVILTICGHPSPTFSHREIESFKKMILQEIQGVVSLFLQIKIIQEGRPTQYNEMVLHGPDHIHEKLMIAYPDGNQKEFVFKISPSSFFQPNTLQAEKLFAQALRMVSKPHLGTVLDLYCGTATLVIMFSSLAKQVLGIEINPYSVFDAEVNQEANGIHNLEVLQGDVGDILHQRALKEIDLVIVDPPRAVLGAKSIEQVVRVDRKEILYISCNPYTQIEDVKDFLRRGYLCTMMQPVDQFPHSAHMENIIVLQRKNGT